MRLAGAGVVVRQRVGNCRVGRNFDSSNLEEYGPLRTNNWRRTKVDKGEMIAELICSVL